MDNGGDNADGLSILSQTNTSMWHIPNLVGIQDYARGKDCLGDK